MSSPQQPPVRSKGGDEVHIPWISEGTSSDGDTVSITAATRPSLEDVVLGLTPRWEAAIDALLARAAGARTGPGGREAEQKENPR